MVLSRTITNIWTNFLLWRWHKWFYNDANLILDENKHSIITRWFTEQNFDFK